MPNDDGLFPPLFSPVFEAATLSTYLCTSILLLVILSPCATSDTWMDYQRKDLLGTSRVPLFIQPRIPDCWLLSDLPGGTGDKILRNQICENNLQRLYSNFPDRNVPTILVYNDSAIKGTCVGLQKFVERNLHLNCGDDSSRNNVIEGDHMKFIGKVIDQDDELWEDEDVVYCGRFPR
ncbi:uncharacterized protein [Triticum aestivum]|uniref:uncharacterized protein n=1 Tax=Triticum aestivum TaxID=4565 RepID=UPI001D014197|nr:uncharacterized protein LOC123133727 [Triticum aestivum]